MTPISGLAAMNGDAIILEEYKGSVTGYIFKCIENVLPLRRKSMDTLTAPVFGMRLDSVATSITGSQFSWHVCSHQNP